MQLLRTKRFSFVYLVHAVPSSSRYFTPYAFKVVPFKKLDRTNFLTMSSEGVTKFGPSEVIFTPLDAWEEEYDKFSKLMEIKSLANFRMWKAFSVWRKNITWGKYVAARRHLAQALFILDPALRKAILGTTAAIYNLQGLTLTDASKHEDLPLSEFIRLQMSKQKDVAGSLSRFHTMVKELMGAACLAALLDRGFVPDDSNFPAGVHMTYTQQANKRRFCTRLCSFIQMCDFIVHNMLHHVMQQSLTQLESEFRRHFQFLPDKALLESDDIENVLEQPRPPGEPQSPFFRIDVLVSSEGLFLDPTKQVFVDAVMKLLADWQETVVRIMTFLSDPFFDPFCEPVVNRRQEDRLCGYGPELLAVLKRDKLLDLLSGNIISYVCENFDFAEAYVQRFQFIQDFLGEDLVRSPVSITDETDLKTMKFLAFEFHKQIKVVEDMILMQPIGLLLLNFQTFKDTTTPVSKSLLDLVEVTLPELGRKNMKAVITKTRDAQTFLDAEPRSVDEFVNYVSFLDEAQALVASMEESFAYLKELYGIIDDFKIECPQEDMANFQNYSGILASFQMFVEQKFHERSAILQKLEKQLSHDFDLLTKQVSGIQKEALEPWLLDPNSNPEDVKVALNTLLDKLIECQKLSAAYKDYQKQYKMEVLRFEALDKVMADVRLRKLLRDSMEEWQQLVTAWTDGSFKELDPDDMSQQTAKMMKYVAQLERGLPPNLIVPMFKISVESMRDQLPLITNLRNPALKPRHWASVEQVLNHKFTPDEPLTLRLLKEVGAFYHLAEVEQISAQASSEASLEGILKKVEDSWKSLEFVVLRYKDAKDVFILSGIEEVQQTLDDSNINMYTIVSSPNIGPIKPRVDEWVRKLHLFGETLEAWINCQQSWMYLETIFTAPDIQRQLPNEAKMFLVVDKSFKDIMRRTAKMPLAMESATAPDVLDELKRNNMLLEDIMKCLDAYLESKRMVFPRFYFLSNDELIEILAQTRNPLAVQPHLRKCFDAIAKLEFGTYKAEEDKDTDEDTDDGEDEEGEQSAVSSMPPPPGTALDILAMVSPEGETVPLIRGLRARGNVEDWLGKVEEGMFSSLRRRMQAAIRDHEKRTRRRWILRHPSQIVLTVSQIMWSLKVHNIFNRPTEEERLSAMADFETYNYDELNELAGMVRGKLRKLQRMVLCSLITIDVHARDIITELVKEKVHRDDSFEWLKQLRYYWDEDSMMCFAHMSSARHMYGYEYLGASPRLVITPLTDKCYLCLMGALQLDLGGAPAGPAGTGKTETTKDLAKSLAIQCVVFNCSEGLDYKMMGRFFAGLAQSGAWCCFDEFNRIDIEVLSVIAQQLITIRNAKVANVARFMFEGREIKLVHSCAAFITMNPGYAGRTELPDNLKALFRPVSMMVPDYALIAEVILYSEGFESSKGLAQKMVQMYKLSSEQLSQQDHYDFGMRAVKSVLVMAGSLKRENPFIREDVVLIRALRDSNLPKFLADDAVLFKGILNDLFPGVVIPEQDYGALQEAIVAVIEAEQLQPEPCVISRVIQLHETLIVRHGVMLVGPTGGGKTTVLNVLKDTLTRLHADGVRGQHYRPVNMHVLNPKAVTMGELYGEVNLLSMEWRDGLLAIMVREAVKVTEDDHQWVVCDGPVDAVWIENMNTVLDDNKMLCLANSERIKLTPRIRMLFEVQDLAQASPATVSRCGMVYVDAEELKWMPYVKTWMAKLELDVPDGMKAYILSHFENYVEAGFVFVHKECSCAINQVDISKAAMMCNLIQSLLLELKINWNFELGRLKMTLAQVFVFSYLWSLGGNVEDMYKEKVESFVRLQLDTHPDVRLPMTEDLWNLYTDPISKVLVTWDGIIPPFKFDAKIPFFDMLVPTTDTVRYGYVLERLLSIGKPVMYTGQTGVGKSVISKEVLTRLSVLGPFLPVTINFSAQTSSTRTQEILESKLDKKRKTLMAPPMNKKLIFFVDDVNMPRLDTYGSQPPIELLRQYLDFGGLYDREKLFWKEIQDVTIMAACAPPGGGRNPLTPRFVRHFAMLCISSPTAGLLSVMFKAIIKGFLDDFAAGIQVVGDGLVAAAVEVYQRISKDLLPTPAKSHYIFNLRDLSKCVQGILQADSGTMREKADMLRLFYHECLRVFHDRLVSVEDKSYFYRLMEQVCTRELGHPILALPQDTEGAVTQPPRLLFGDFMNPAVARAERIYEEIRDYDKLKTVMEDYLDDYNLVTSKEMRLIFFVDAMEHATRLARILRAERGNGLLVGVGGMGKQSLSRLASHMCGYKCFQIELTRLYNYVSFHEDLRKLYFDAGANGEDSTFLFTDTQIVTEDFLEDINNILNSGDVPNLFDKDELEKVINAMRKPASDVGIDENNRDAIFEYFITRVRRKLHLVICMSPVAEDFRRRCRMFPSLVNCCTIDWFVEWPQEALLSVAQNSLKVVDEEHLKGSLAQAFVFIHESVGKMSIRFFEEMRRHYYITPSSYLELIKLYLQKLNLRKENVTKKRDRIDNGLKKLRETHEVVDTMEEDVRALRPLLQVESDSTEQLLKSLTKQQAQADQVRTVVLSEEAVAKVKAEETQKLKEEAEKDLAQVTPALEAATEALKALNKNDINELKVFIKPPALVKFVMEAVCVLFNVKTDWPSAKLLLGDSNFLKNLQDYDKDSISDAMMKKLKVYVDHTDFDPDAVAKQSKVCRSICIWVRAIAEYAKAFRVVLPKRIVVEEAERELNKVLDELKEKQQRLAAVEKQIAELEATYNEKVTRMKQLAADIDLATKRLTRAGQLTSALKSEQVLWEHSIKDLDEDLRTMVGDVLMAAASVSYLGAFTSVYRDELVDLWLAKNSQLAIPSSAHYSLTSIMADAFEIREWNSYGLPRDKVSTENGIFVMRAGKWPLMIDPQEQANSWIRHMEAKNNLRIEKLTDSNFSRVLEICIRQGFPLLVEEVGEFLDPSLAPLLLKQIFTEGGRLQIRLGDSNVDYNKNFRLYMTSKLSNPHYLPEICILVTLVNFTVTPSGLEDQLLSDVVRLEKPQLEQQRTDVITAINKDKTELESIEEKILHMLFASQGNILDDEELVQTLNDSVVTAEGIEERLVDAEKTEEKISEAREKYRVVATRGSVLFFVVAELANIDSMYQFSLRYFKQVFNTVTETSEQSTDQQVRLATLLDEITKAVFISVSRGLFERHKRVFSFMMCASILRQRGEVDDACWNFLLRGPVTTKQKLLPKPTIPALTDAMWFALCYLNENFPKFKGLALDIEKKITIKIGDFDELVGFPSSDNSPSTDNWNNSLTPFEKLMLLKCLKEEKLTFAITKFVKLKLGQIFIEYPPASLQSLYEDMTNVIPLVFVLSTGSDPFSAFQRFAVEKGFQDRIHSISLGQGQGPVAEKMLREGVQHGHWVFLQNCHLATSWMLPMEDIIRSLAEAPDKIHPDYRLFLSSMPSRDFPVSVLQNSVKVTNEPPMGLRANIRRAFFDLSQDFFEVHELNGNWRRMVFGLCFFHAIIQERKKFGSLGWNITYEFSDSDRECALATLAMFCAGRTIPWDALIYITGVITYGGRVTDYWDQRCLTTILQRFFDPRSLDPDYKYSESGIYYCPERPTFNTLQQYRMFIEKLPIIEDPEIFGMHENANLAFQMKESQEIVNTILHVQPSQSSSVAGRSSDDIVFDVAESILVNLPTRISTADVSPILMKIDSKGRLPSLTTVVLQEVDRYNRLLAVIHTSLADLQKAIKGLVVMSEALEEVFKACLINQVPKMWSSVGYLSMKTLGSWTQDLLLRLDFVSSWVHHGPPVSFWLSGFFFTQGFLTGTLQTHARKYDLPIDELQFDFIMKHNVLKQNDVYAKRLESNREDPEFYDGLAPPVDGVLVHGLFLDAARWDFDKMRLADQIPGEMNPALPVMLLLPKKTVDNTLTRYVCPLYKTTARAGVLSTTGHSTNFVVAVLLPTKEEQSYWILKGTALVTQITD
ncbi:dynein axonemal heavy chain 6 isoform X2 [Bacillus rossius redtenbacheri]